MQIQKHMPSLQDTVKNLVRALRLPFVSASIFPYLLGSLIAKNDFHTLRFLLGLVAAVSTHLSANLINDYADSKSGADWKDLNFYGFFGGSKLIQDKVLTEQFFLNGSIIFAVCAALSVFTLAVVLKSFTVVVFFLLIIALAWMYSAKPLQLSYHRAGEIIIFLLFGPALVMGAHFIQTGLFPTLQGFFMSLPMGFLVTSILFVNEIPDVQDDRDARKYTWVSVSGPDKAWLWYLALMSAAFLSVLVNVARGYVSPFVLVSLILLIPFLKAASIVRTQHRDKVKLIASSKLTIAVHSMVSSILILDLLLVCKK